MSIRKAFCNVIPGRCAASEVWSFGPSRNDSGSNKKPAVVSDGRPLLAHERLRGALRYATLTETTARETAPYETTSAVTRPTPALVRPIARAAPVDRSRTRP